MPHCTTLLHAKNILTQDSERNLLEEASLAIHNGKIVAIGPRQELAPVWQAQEERDLGNVLVLPGLINAHTHAAMTLLRGYADDLPLLAWLEQKIFPREAQLTAEIVELFSLLGFAEMLATGTTACLDMYLFQKAVFAAAKRAGIRLSAGEGVFAFPSASCANWQEALAITEDLAQSTSAESRLEVMVSPHSVYTTSPELLTACLSLAQKRNLPLHLHLSESPQEVAQCQQSHGLSPIAYCAERGLLTQPAALAHVVAVSDDDLKCLTEANAVTVLHCPGSNMKLASGAARIPEMHSLGIPIALGTDGAASNNQLNMFLEMNRAALLHKLVAKNPEVLPAGTVFDMATLGGAKALQHHDLGSLEVGKWADLTALDLSAPNLLPCYAPISHLVYAATGHEVVLTMVEGEILYDHGTFTRFDYEALCQEIRQITDALQRKAL
ncbi:MAG: amidohydrolase [Desulfovibrio sp.]|nr:amidohydrolase [Desulfovibrio sp.]